MSIEKTLAERGARYGKFADHAEIAQHIQEAIRVSPGWDRLAADQKQALTVIADKIARMLNGDPDYVDNWHDIIGYAKLVEDRLLGQGQGIYAEPTTAPEAMEAQTQDIGTSYLKSAAVDARSANYVSTEQKLVDALWKDHANSPDAEHRFMGKLGPASAAVLAGIIGETPPQGLDPLGWPLDANRLTEPSHVDQAVEQLLTFKRINWPEASNSFLEALQADRARLHAIINEPESDEFLKGVSIEAEYQRQKHGVDDSPARFDFAQYLWVAGYLLNKALGSCVRNDWPKAKHHLVTSAALLHNWHNVLVGKPAATVHTTDGGLVADSLASNSES